MNIPAGEQSLAKRCLSFSFSHSLLPLLVSPHKVSEY